MKKVKWKHRLITLAALLAAMTAVVELERWMKSRADCCPAGVCPPPGGDGLYIDPFPDEIVPATTATSPSPALGHPVTEGMSKTPDGLAATTNLTKELNNE